MEEKTTQSRVLVVEDEAIVAMDIRRRLDSLGYAVCGSADSGERALELATALSPDIVLMDIMLAGPMDGVSAAASIRETLSIPIVFLTAHSDRETLRRAGATGPYGYVIKPFDDRELSTALDLALYKARMERRLFENERWMAITLQNLDEGVISADPDGRVRYANPVAQKLLGLSAEQVLGQGLADIYTTQAETPQAIGERITSSREGRMVVRADGQVFPVEQKLSPIIDDRGRRLGSLLVFRDISRRESVEQALQESISCLRRAFKETVNALAVTSEKRDPFTAGHQERVSHLALALAGKLGLCVDEREGIRVAGLVHDIGKIYVPAEVLSKAEALSEIEMGIVREHSQVGYEILKDIPFPWPVARMVLEHHERLNGSGYPGGLRGEAILLGSRILAVSDVVEAMNSHRPYRVARGLDKALAEISTGRGELYDPTVVDACLQLFSRGEFQF